MTGLVTKVRENGATTGIGVLATYTYDNLARRTAVANGNGTSSSYSFDPVSRLSSLTQDLAGTLNDLTISISAYNPSSQIVTQSRSNDLYAWTGHGNGSTDTVTNGLNQLSTVGGVAATHDARGNLTSDPASGNSYAYSSEDLLTSATVGGNAVTLAYDPLLRLTQVAGTATTKFGYDGLDTLAEADGGGTILRRYVPGDGIDQPIVWYEGTGTTDRRWFHADERGSIVSVSEASGNMLSINTYDEYGKPGAANSGRFQYTGQKWLPELGGYDYKARFYAPALGRFLQTDPIGYGSGPNIYAYVRGDPINGKDPQGTGTTDPQDPNSQREPPRIGSICNTTFACEDGSAAWFVDQHAATLGQGFGSATDGVSCTSSVGSGAPTTTGPGGSIVVTGGAITTTCTQTVGQGLLWNASGPIAPGTPVIPGKTLEEHLCAKHYCGMSGSTFFSKYSNNAAVLMLIQYAADHGNGLTIEPGLVEQIAYFPTDVGLWNGVATNVYTVTLYERRSGNLTVWTVSNIFPGLPNWR